MPTPDVDPFRWAAYAKRVEDLLQGMEVDFLAILAEVEDWPDEVPALTDEAEHCDEGHALATVAVEMCEGAADDLLSDIVRCKMFMDPEAVVRIVRWAYEIAVGLVEEGVNHHGWKVED